MYINQCVENNWTITVTLGFIKPPVTELSHQETRVPALTDDSFLGNRTLKCPAQIALTQQSTSNIRGEQTKTADNNEKQTLRYF